MSKQLRDSAFRLISKITEDMENKRFKKAFEDLDKAEKIAKKIKNPDVSYHTFFLRGYAESEEGELESALEHYIRAL
jgi:tetratricopeptide (TPR) repeat protein